LSQAVSSSYDPLSRMSQLEMEIFELAKEITPQSMYLLGIEEVGDRVFILSKENIQSALAKIRKIKEKCTNDDDKGRLARKYLESVETQFEFEEPLPDIGMITDILSTHLIKEGVQPERYRKLLDQMVASLNASIEKFEGTTIAPAVRVLVQYQVLGVREVLDVIEKEAKDDSELLQSIARLRERVHAFSKRFDVPDFMDGQFDEVIRILKRDGAELGRSEFYKKALRYGFDYSETPSQLERKAISWIDEELPKLRKATRSLAKIHKCKAEPESVNEKLKSMPGVRPQEALATTIKIRPIIRAFVAESVVGFNPKYETTVVETPPYLTPILPTAAAQGFDTLTDHPSQRYFLTTDPKRAPPSGFADLVNTLVHEEYGHCLHYSNTATHFAAEPSIIEMLSSLHSGTTSEGLAFQREQEFLDALHRLDKKRKKKASLTNAEKGYVELTSRFGGFERILIEMEFTTYWQRIIRFLRVVGDARINSGKQDLLSFLDWAKRKTGLAQRTVYFQIFPAHEGIFPGYATCYAVVGQEIKSIQKQFKNDPEKLVRFNAYACSMGFPARSIYIRRLRDYAANLLGIKVGKRKSKTSRISSSSPRRKKKKR
jgi:hypothetical protein